MIWVSSRNKMNPPKQRFERGNSWSKPWQTVVLSKSWSWSPRPIQTATSPSLQHSFAILNTPETISVTLFGWSSKSAQKSSLQNFHLPGDSTLLPIFTTPAGVCLSHICPSPAHGRLAPWHAAGLPKSHPPSATILLRRSPRALPSWRYLSLPRCRRVRSLLAKGSWDLKCNKTMSVTRSCEFWRVLAMSFGSGFSYHVGTVSVFMVIPTRFRQMDSKFGLRLKSQKFRICLHSGSTMYFHKVCIDQSGTNTSKFPSSWCSWFVGGSSCPNGHSSPAKSCKARTNHCKLIHIPRLLVPSPQSYVILQQVKPGKIKAQWKVLGHLGSLNPLVASDSYRIICVVFICTITLYSWRIPWKVPWSP